MNDRWQPIKMALDGGNIGIQVLQHRKTDLLVAISDDLSGLMVPGRSKDELQRKLPAAIQELLEAQGVNK